MATPDQSRRDFIKTTGAAVLAAAAGAGAPTTQLAPPDAQPPNLKVPKPKTNTVGYAIVGLGTLALNQILPAFKTSKLCRPVALVSGHLEKARQVADVYGIDPKAIYSYDNYERMADNKDINAVYVVLPNSMHAEYTIRAAKAGKHVLCEKPMAANVAECQQMIDACRAAQKKLMVAYRLHYEPYNRTAIEMCRRKEFGDLRFIESTNAQNTRAPNIRLSKKLAGGPLQDIGVYCINACRYLSGEEPVEVTGQIFQPSDDPNFAEVPRDVMWTMSFPGGISAHCGISFNSGGSRRYRVHGTGGWLDLEKAFDYSGQELRTNKGQLTTKHDLPYIDHFAAEMDHFAECVMQNKDPVTPGEEGLADMKVIAAIEEAARTGRRVKV